MDTVLIPAYEPGEELLPLTKQLKEAGFAIVVVNDGSGPAYQEIFDGVAEYAHVLTHKKNRGKGAALKTGMRYIRASMPDAEHFITCDADGQHKVEDVLRVQEKLQAGHKFVLTMRRIRKDIPWRSKVGNSLSRVVYALLTKRYLSDNQSGLRGFHRSNIEWMLQVEKDNYDYEMNVLYYAAKKAVTVYTIPIEAIYINNNQSSHFRPILDTVRIYKSLFALAIGQFAGILAAFLWLLLASLWLGNEHLMFSVPSAGVYAYVANILINKLFVFRHTRCYDYITLLIHQIIDYFQYTLGCMLVAYMFPWIPVWLAFLVVFLLYLPLRYWSYKFNFIAQQTRG